MSFCTLTASFTAPACVGHNTTPRTCWKSARSESECFINPGGDRIKAMPKVWLLVCGGKAHWWECKEKKKCDLRKEQTNGQINKKDKSAVIHDWLLVTIYQSTVAPQKLQLQLDPQILLFGFFVWLVFKAIVLQPLCWKDFTLRSVEVPKSSHER